MSSVMRFDEWQDSNGVPVASGAGGAFSAPGNIIEVKHAIFTGIQDASVAAGANVAVTDLSITHTLANASNKLIISAYFGAAANSFGYGNTGIAVADDGTLINLGNAAGNRRQVSAGGFISGSSEPFPVTMPSLTFVYEPGDTSSHTYTVRAINLAQIVRTVYINRSQSDIDNGDYSRATSGFVIQEVSV